MIINIRGTNGSGKTTIVLALMQGAARVTPIRGVLGPRKPEAYELVFEDIADPVFVLGSYHLAKTADGDPLSLGTSGCDQIQPYDLILDLLRKYAPRGHVLFEGVLVSSSYGRVGRLMEEFGPERAVMAFLDTTLEACIANVQKRRDGQGDTRPFNPHNLTTKFNQIKGGKDKIREAGKVRVIDLTQATAVRTVMALLD